MPPPDDRELDALLASLNPHTHPPAQSPPALEPILRAAERRRRRRRLKFALPLVPVLAGAITAGALALRASPPADLVALTVDCSADLTLNKTYTTQVTGPSPIQDCARAWAAGLVEPTRRTVPPLTACVVNGATRVYPVVDACRLLSLPPFAGYSAAQTAALTLNDTLQALVRSLPPCRPAREIADLANRQLGLAELTGWQVVIRRDPACGGVIVAVDRKTIYVV